ncbi:DUF6236 family protein [Kosakonia sp.]|uniref:DUF6236 family protein n=1 Tax=Kosakonia sp. TaxID=1916651 RepID=UPI0028AC903C|nr:DUF6236 family protein [Kosakonia sp.]
MKRGVVASPVSIEVLDTGGFRTTGGLSRADVNYYSLYWDKVVIPGSREIYFSLEEEESLLRLGVVERPRVSIGMNTDNYVHAFPIQQLRIYEELQSKVGEYNWYLHQIGNKLALPFTEDKLRNLQFELFNALPVPDGNVKPEEILEFKYKNADYFISFHNYLDELYADVAYAPDEPLFQKKAYDKFNTALADINTISEINKKFFWQRYNLKIEMPNSKEFVATVLGALTAAADTSNPLVTSLGLLTAGVGLIKINDKYEKTLKSTNDEANLVYLAEAYKHNILK